MMRIEFDPNKSATNARTWALPFELVAELDWSGALVSEDTRKPYPERRFVALAPLAGRLHVVCFTPVPGGIRVISFRKANAREVQRHDHP